jgi:transcriptional regulator with XRE-family HTH domain
MDATLFGKNVLVRRKEKKLSQEQLAKFADISRNYISMVERGAAKNVSDEIIRKLAFALEVSIEELTGLARDESAIMIPAPLREFGIAKGLSYKIIDKLRQVPFRGQEPQTPDEWEKLYEAIKQFITED